jgi:two-component system, NtrC family, sensor kinase
MIYAKFRRQRTIDPKAMFRRLFGLDDRPDESLHLNRFAEFGRGASGIIHDLSNPLTVINLSIEQLYSNRQIRSSEAKKHLETALRASRKMKSFLITAKKQLGHTEVQTKFNASEEIRGVAKILRHVAKKYEVKIKFRSQRAVFISGDEIKFFRVISNIVSNSIDAYARTHTDRNKVIIIRLKSDKNSISVSVKDFACGIPKHFQKTVFEPFYTTKQKHEGAAGLGLSIVKNIVEHDFGGKIKLESTPGRGSMFKIIFPQKPG